MAITALLSASARSSCSAAAMVIGRTPMRMFDPDRNPAIFLEAGMWVRFRAVGKAEFDEIEAATAARTYRPEILEEVSPRLVGAGEVL